MEAGRGERVEQRNAGLGARASSPRQAACEGNGRDPSTGKCEQHLPLRLVQRTAAPHIQPLGHAPLQARALSRGRMAGARLFCCFCNRVSLEREAPERLERKRRVGRAPCSSAGQPVLPVVPRHGLVCPPHLRCVAGAPAGRWTPRRVRGLRKRASLRRGLPFAPPTQRLRHTRVRERAKRRDGGLCPQRGSLKRLFGNAGRGGGCQRPALCVPLGQPVHSLLSGGNGFGCHVVVAVHYDWTRHRPRVAPVRGSRAPNVPSRGCHPKGARIRCKLQRRC